MDNWCPGVEGSDEGPSTSPVGAAGKAMELPPEEEGIDLDAAGVGTCRPADFIIVLLRPSPKREHLILSPSSS